MNLLTENRLEELLTKQNRFFKSHQTKDVAFRKKNLQKLLDVIELYSDEITLCLKKDLNKSPEEAFLSEINLVKTEVKFHLRHLKKWTRIKKVSTPLYLLPSRSRIQYEPLGVALVIAPWNYPFQLLFNPLVGILSSGCCAILKPSPEAPHIAELMEKMIKEIYPEEYITVVHGAKEENQLLFKKRFDHIFFTVW